MAQDSLTEKTKSCPAIFEEKSCYITGQECRRKVFAECPEYQGFVQPRGDELYRATIRAVNSRKVE